MYVVSTARSNSTEFCLKYSFDNNKQFMGELTYAINNPLKPDAIGAPFVNIKQEFHETGIQPTYTIPNLVTNWSNISDPNTLSLIRVVDNMPLYDNAAFLITRKNIREQLLSMVNYRLKVFVGITGSSIITVNTFNMMNLCSVLMTHVCVLLQYAKVYSREITWTEDFSTPSTLYPYIDAWENKTEFLILLDRQLAKIDFASFNNQIIISP